MPYLHCGSLRHRWQGAKVTVRPTSVLNSNFCLNFRIQPKALEALQDAAESYLVGIFEDTNLQVPPHIDLSCCGPLTRDAVVAGDSCEASHHLSQRFTGHVTPNMIYQNAQQ